MIPSIVHKTGELLNITLLPNSPKESATDLDSLASDKYKSIKAFRTITTMLHHIPSQHEISVERRNRACGFAGLSKLGSGCYGVDRRCGGAEVKGVAELVESGVETEIRS